MKERIVRFNRNYKKNKRINMNYNYKSQAAIGFGKIIVINNSKIK